MWWSKGSMFFFFFSLSFSTCPTCNTEDLFAWPFKMAAPLSTRSSMTNINLLLGLKNLLSGHCHQTTIKKNLKAMNSFDLNKMCCSLDVAGTVSCIFRVWLRRVLCVWLCHTSWFDVVYGYSGMMISCNTGELVWPPRQCEEVLRKQNQNDGKVKKAGFCYWDNIKLNSPRALHGSWKNSVTFSYFIYVQNP